MTVQWYPGHMTKTRRMMEAHMKQVDLVIELLDARVPRSSKNPDIDTLTAGKPRLVVLTKADLANASITARWEEYFRQSGFFPLPMDLSQSSKKKAGVPKLMDAVQKITAEKLARQRKKGRLAVPVRIMVVGIPNVGKSTFINMIAGRAVAAVADRPGVTRGRQWISVRPSTGAPYSAFGGFDLMDTPGVLWHKFEDPEVGLRLAVTGAISDTIVDKITLAEELIQMLANAAPQALHLRYALPPETAQPRAALTEIGGARGFKMKGGVIDLERTAVMLLDEFRGGKLGRITLESP
ncbi:MAG: ribosome biogenesis GTPase YlqF [Defluviitaleaceae bacterium]|nr:ribosome biogenesis GTPase YlqF [Defluviitaleaceae bacterium]MCL2238681.1 ribosome biogenesis GTPase YlqF [Defluviitaleaceae bacterium]